MDRVSVINPTVANTTPALQGASRPEALKDAVVAFVDNSKQNADLFIEALQPVLREDYGVNLGVKIRKFAPKDELSDRELAELAKCDAVIQCVGD